jgi:hypothetical protein
MGAVFPCVRRRANRRAAVPGLGFRREALRRRRHNSNAQKAPISGRIGPEPNRTNVRSQKSNNQNGVKCQELTPSSTLITPVQNKRGSLERGWRGEGFHGQFEDLAVGVAR